MSIFVVKFHDKILDRPFDHGYVEILAMVMVKNF